MLRLTLAQKGVTAVTVLLLFELILIGSLANLLHETEVKLTRANEVRTVISHLNRLANLFHLTTIGINRVIQHQVISHETEQQSLNSVIFKTKYFNYVQQIPNEFAVLKELLKSSPRELAVIQDIEDVCMRGLKMMEDCRRAWFERDLTMHLTYAGRLQQMGDYMVARENRLLEDYAKLEESAVLKESESRQNLEKMLVFGGILNVLGAVSLALVFTRNITDRLRTLKQNSSRLAMGKELHSIMEGTDEIAQLDQVFHNMAETLDAAARKERAIIDNASDLICSIDKNGRFATVSCAAENILGLGQSDVVGQRFLQIVADEDKMRTKELMAEISSSGNNLTFENTLIDAQGKPIESLWSVQWSAPDQTWFCVIHDITVRKREELLIKSSEERIRAVIENLPIGVITLDTDGTIQSVNSMTANIFHADQSMLLNEPISKLLDCRKESLLEILEVLSDLRAGKTLERDGRRLSGARFPVSITASKYDSFEGERLLVSVQDITERREIEQLKQEFVAMISHDLRTPLTSIGGTLTLLLEGIYGPLEGKGTKRVEDAQRSVERLIGLVSDLLDLEKLEAGKLTVVFEACNLSTVVDRAISSVQAYAEQNMIVIESNTCDSIVSADSDRLVQVLVNLISNAIKFSNPGNKVSIAVMKSNEQAKVAVSDCGRGIPPEFQEAIFEKFKQVKVSDGKRTMGSGLGLSICKAIIESHQGKIGVESDGKSGSTFWFEVPTKQIT